MTVRSIAAGLLLCAWAHAQVPARDDGPLVHAPALFSVDLATKVGAAADRGADGLAKRTSFHGTNDPPPLLAGPGVPDFSGKALLRACTGGGIPKGKPLPDIDATSLGLDVIHADSRGRVRIPPRRWSGIELSVRKGTRGLAGTRIAAERGRPGGNQADFFFYVFRGADCIPPEFVDRTFKDADADEVWLPDGAEVDAVDVYAALYSRGLAVVAGLPPRPTLYFSVTDATRARVPASWWGGAPASGATILKTTWNGSSWSCPTLAFRPAQLGLGPCEDVDAFGYDAGSGEVVFSTTPPRAGCVKARNPLLYVRPGANPRIEVLRYGGGFLAEAVAESIGLDERRPDDDVDGVCVLDPACEGRTGGVAIERAFGQPFNDPLTWLHAIPGCPCPRRLEIQAHRRRIPQATRYEVVVVNGTPGGVGIAMVSSLSPSSPFWPLGSPFHVPAKAPWAGVPVGMRITIPALVRSWDFLLYAATLQRDARDIRVTYPLRLR